jgi:hypothetical protein
MAKHSKAHPGFKGAAREVERKEGVSKESANKIIGYGKAHASASARKANPRLNKKGGR